MKKHTLLGQKFGRWTVITEASSSPNGHSKWLCRCDCGNEKQVFSTSLVRGISQSCGCISFEKLAERNEAQSADSYVKGGKYLKEYNAWNHIKNRCHNPNDQAYSRYGGRGIKVCERWRNSFKAFLADMGPVPSVKHSIERINNDLGYSPDNCKWATRREQASNTSRTIRVTFQGEQHPTLRALASSAGLKESSLRYFYTDCGLPIEEAVAKAAKRPT